MSQPLVSATRLRSAQTTMNLPPDAAATCGLEQKLELVFTRNSLPAGAPLAANIRA